MSGLSGITITKYTHTLATEWDRFIEESRNGTFLHKRGYMDYHANRFNDHSLMFYNNGKLIAALPAHIKDNSLCSHNGITYGGLILGEECTTETTLEIFNTLRSYLRANTAATEIIYRPTPHIYHRSPCEEDIYALFRNGAVLTECKASSAIELCNPIKPKGRRRLTAAMKSRLHIKEENDYTSFWTILNNRLQSKYGSTPVHSLSEITLLHNRFPQNIRLFTIGDDGGNTLGGVVLYITEKVVHMQYCGTTDEGRRISALDHLYDYLINDLFKEKRYFDFGTSVEEGGHYLNSGLIAYKERLGGRTITYNTYLIDLKTSTL